MSPRWSLEMSVSSMMPCQRTLERCRQDAAPWCPSEKAHQWSGVGVSQPTGPFSSTTGVFIRTSFVSIFSFIYEIWNIWGNFLIFLLTYAQSKLDKYCARDLQNISWSPFLNWTLQNAAICHHYVSNTWLYLSYPEEPIIYSQTVKIIYCSRWSDLPYQKFNAAFTN